MSSKGKINERNRKKKWGKKVKEKAEKKTKNCKKRKILSQARSSFASLGNRALTSPNYNKSAGNRRKNGNERQKPQNKKLGKIVKNQKCLRNENFKKTKISEKKNRKKRKNRKKKNRKKRKKSFKKNRKKRK
jgi:hypothetical protein